jgi:hypothetical protein
LTPVGGSVLSSFLSDVDGDALVDVVLEKTPASGFVPVGRNASVFSRQFQYRNEVAVLRGGGNGAFAAAATIPDLVSSGIAPGDVDGDGHTDFVALVRDPNRVETWLADETAGFRRAHSFEIGRRFGVLTLLDLNGDARLDLASLNPLSNKFAAYFWLGRGDGTFGPPHKIHTQQGESGIASGDLNGDGRFDFVVVNAATGNVSVYLGTGPNSFGFPTFFQADARSAPRLADFDGDGALDLAFIGGGGGFWYYSRIAVMPGDGRGGFGERRTFGASNARDAAVIEVGDLDRSGAADVLVGHFDEPENHAVLLSDLGNCLLPDLPATDGSGWLR